MAESTKDQVEGTNQTSTPTGEPTPKPETLPDSALDGIWNDDSVETPPAKPAEGAAEPAGEAQSAATEATPTPPQEPAKPVEPSPDDKYRQQAAQAAAALERTTAQLAELLRQQQNKAAAGKEPTPEELRAIEKTRESAAKSQAKLNKLGLLTEAGGYDDLNEPLVKPVNEVIEHVETLSNEIAAAKAELAQMKRESAEKAQLDRILTGIRDQHGFDAAPLIAEAAKEVVEANPDLTGEDPVTKQVYGRLVNAAFWNKVKAKATTPKAAPDPKPSPSKPSSKPSQSTAGAQTLKPGATSPARAPSKVDPIDLIWKED